MLVLIGFIVALIIGGLITGSGLLTLLAAIRLGSRHKSDYIGGAIMLGCGIAVLWYSIASTNISISFTS